IGYCLYAGAAGGCIGQGRSQRKGLICHRVRLICLNPVIEILRLDRARTGTGLSGAKHVNSGKPKQFVLDSRAAHRAADLVALGRRERRWIKMRARSHVIVLEIVVETSMVLVGA